MKDIYELLNEVDIDFSNVTEMEVDELERKRGKKRLMQSIYKRRNNTSKIIAGISALIIAGSLSVVVSSPTIAANIPIIGSLIQKNLIDVNKEYENYLNVIGTTQSIEDVDVTFENAIVDKNMLFLSFVVKDNNRCIEGMDAFGTMNVKVNGKEINTSGGGEHERIDEHTIRILRTFNWNYDKLPENMNIEIDMHLPNLITAREKFKTKFSVDTNEIEEKTYTKKLNKSFMVSDIQCRIEEITVSPLLTNLKYYAETENDGFMLNFVIYDQDGREIKFNGGESTTKGSEGYREGKIDFNMKYINTENIKQLKFVPAYSLGTFGDEIIDEKEAFTLNLN